MATKLKTIIPVARPKVQVFMGRCGNGTSDYDKIRSAQKSRCSRVDVATELQTIIPSLGPKSKCSWVDVGTEVSETAVLSATEGGRKESGWVSRVRRSLPIHLSWLKTLGKQGAHTHRVRRGVSGGERTWRCGWSGGLLMNGEG